MKPILMFDKDNAFLSNFAAAEFVWEGIVWKNSEAAYQAAKSTDRAIRLKFSTIASPAAAKKAGKVVALRPDWEEVKYETMHQIVFAKFNQNPELKEKLLATGHVHLEEGNNWNDRIWGVCPPGSNQGKNWLGEILMKVRDEFRLERMWVM